MNFIVFLCRVFTIIIFQYCQFLPTINSPYLIDEGVQTLMSVLPQLLLCYSYWMSMGYLLWVQYLASDLWGKILIPMYIVWLPCLYGLYGLQCLLSPERPLNLITHSLASVLLSLHYCIWHCGIFDPGVKIFHTSTRLYWTLLWWGPGGHFKNTYELLNLRALKISMLYKNHIFQCMGKIFCVEFRKVPLKFRTKYNIIPIHWKM